VSFKEIKSAVQKQFEKLQKHDLFYVNIDRDKIFDLYIEGFAEEFRQEHRCNCCKSFLRQYGGVVAIIEGKMVSVWDIDAPELFAGSVKKLREYVHSLPIHSTFFAEQRKCGTDRNRDGKRDIIWEHFFVEMDKKFVKSNIDTINGQNKNNKAVFKRALEEITLDSVETVLELIDQNSLYRGKEFEGGLKAFQKVQKLYAKAVDKDLFAWGQSLVVGPAICGIRNSSIGTLLTDLSEGMDLDTAVTRFEKVVAPTNYKRPTSLVTPKMVEAAKATLNELGLLDSLDRRFAVPTDISVEDILFIDKQSEAKDVFDSVSKDSVTDVKKLAQVEEIAIEDFLKKVVPKAKSIEVLVENRHMPNFATLIAPEKDSKSMFKWGNNFSWSYTGGITDSIKEKVKAAGGNVVGVIRASLAWNNYDDLDLHCVEPNKNEIYFARKVSATSGHLDVDMNAGCGTTRTPVENIIWTNPSSMREGLYRVAVHNYNKRDTADQGYTLQIESNGEIFDFSEQFNPRTQTYGLDITFNWSRKDGISFTKDIQSRTLSKEKWGVKTNTFVRVKQVMLSPNHWSGNVGNKHYMFMLDGCKSDETPRPFFNEFLGPELDKHRKVLEILGSKVKVKDSDNQLSGIGFSETQKNSVIVRVTGNFARTLKVLF
jgi:uncharacterized protein YfaP (DUF2135 family)